MRRSTHPGIPALLVVALAFVTGCGEDSPASVTGPALGAVVPDFAVSDVNPNSPRNGEAVSPRDYSGQVSAWYFGHAT